MLNIIKRFFRTRAWVKAARLYKTGAYCIMVGYYVPLKKGTPHRETCLYCKGYYAGYFAKNLWDPKARNKSNGR